MSNQPLRVRRSLAELQTDYANGNKKPLEDLMRAWKGIKELHYTDGRSFFNLGGYHGEPFRGAGWGDGSFWGGYCNHGNVLFPTWHRIYCLKVEEALQSIAGCQDVMLPYWDETDADSLANGIPWCLTAQNFELDGVVIPNPLRSFVFPINVTDNVSADNPDQEGGLYSKPKGYETVRYPLSGLVGTAAARVATAAHNAKYPDYDQNVQILNENVKGWLNQTVVLPGGKDKQIKLGVLTEYQKCLRAPNFTVFSNTTSAQNWNDLLDPDAPGAELAVPLEQPHNHIHLAIGGFDVPGQGDRSPIQDANGDMGENDTAALDPIFYFHHCNVDRIFWLWQKQHGHTDALDIIEFYPGTNSSDSQGATPGVPANTWLSLDSPLTPFKRRDGEQERPYNSHDCINIEKQLGHTYSPGSLDPDRNLLLGAAAPEALMAPEPESGRTLRLTRINKAAVKGSFIIAAYANINGERQLIGYKSVLSRWNVAYCANCQVHLEIKAFFKIPAHTESKLLASRAGSEAALQEDDFDVHIITHEPEEETSLLRTMVGKKPRPAFHLEIR